MKRPIAISLSPNTENDDVLLALKMLLSPWSWFDKKEVKKLEQGFARIFGGNYKALAINSGRGAEYLVLKALGIGKGDEVAIQAFTCVAVPNSVLWLGAKPLYIDIDDSYNMDPRGLEKKITEKTRAIIVQHTFGIPANLEKIKKIAQKRKVALIEDCAHALGAKYDNKPVGTLGDVSFFSFGRDKVLSSVFGGMILCSNKVLYKKIKRMRDKLSTSHTSWVAQQLFHPVAFALVLPLYNLLVGKVLLVVLQKLGTLSKAVYNEEKLSKQPSDFPMKMPGPLATLAINQLMKLERYNEHRREIANYYRRNLKGMSLKMPSDVAGAIWLRFPIQVDDSNSLHNFAKSKGMLLGNWYKPVVTPVKDLSLVGYKMGTCPKAEKFSKNVINLPTYPALSKNQAEKVVNLVKQWLNTK